jgi:aldehyde:ferredoxin oxidoreductase
VRSDHMYAGKILWVDLTRGKVRTTRTAAHPVHEVIDNDQVAIRGARHVRGMETYETAKGSRRRTQWRVERRIRELLDP